MSGTLVASIQCCVDADRTGVAAILAKADEEKIKVWKLLDMRQMPTFNHAKLAVIGDAAHPFLPHQGKTSFVVKSAIMLNATAGQGGGQAIEDATSLGALLPAGTPPHDIMKRLELYNKCRYTRAHKIQEFTRLAGRDAHEFKAEEKQLDSKLALFCEH